MTWCGNLIIVTFCNHRFALVMITIMSKSISISKNICTVRIIATDFPKKDLFLSKGNNCVSFKCITIKWSETVSDSCYWWLKVATYQCPYCYFWKNDHEGDHSFNKFFARWRSVFPWTSAQVVISALPQISMHHLDHNLIKASAQGYRSKKVKLFIKISIFRKYF